VLVVYDVTKEPSFKNINNWLRRVENAADVKIVKMLIGNKIDLSNMRAVTTEEGAALAE
jgi:GTPase SAR1 family protein